MKTKCTYEIHSVMACEGMMMVMCMCMRGREPGVSLCHDIL